MPIQKWIRAGRRETRRLEGPRGSPMPVLLLSYILIWSVVWNSTRKKGFQRSLKKKKNTNYPLPILSAKLTPTCPSSFPQKILPKQVLTLLSLHRCPRLLEESSQLVIMYLFLKASCLSSVFRIGPEWLSQTLTPSVLKEYHWNIP